MKRMLALICGATLLLAAGAGTAAAEKPDDAGPGDNNKKGLCTAYFNGQKKGHDKDGDGWTDNQNSPFSGLEGDANDGNPDNDNDGEGDEDLAAEQAIYSDVYEYCQQFGIGGQPEHNGRYDCEEPESDAGRDNDADGQIECYLNDGSSGTDENGDPYNTGDDRPNGKNK